MEIWCNREKKKTKSMVFKISFSEELLSELYSLDEWPNKVKTMQNWIGKSFGCEIDFKIRGSEK